MINVEGYHEYPGGVQYRGGTQKQTIYPLTVLMISPTVLKISPHSTHDTPHSTEHTLYRVKERFDFYVAFTMILCGLNFCVWKLMKLRFTC